MPFRHNRFPDYFGNSSRSIEPVHGNGGRRRQEQELDETELEVLDDVYGIEAATSYPSQSAGRSVFQPNQWASSGIRPAPPQPAPPRQASLGNQSLHGFQIFAYEPNAQAATRRAPSVSRSQAARSTPARNMQTPRRPRQPLPQTPWSNKPGARLNWLRQPEEVRPYGFPTNVYELDEDEDEGNENGDSSTNNNVNNKNDYESYTIDPPPRQVRGVSAYPERSYAQPRRQTHQPARSYEVQPPQQNRLRGLMTTPRNNKTSRPLPPLTPRHSSPSPTVGRQCRTSIQPQYRAAPRVNDIELVSPRSLDKRFHSIFPYEHFNAVQSSCFSCVHGSDDNVVVAAPTGSGKTVIFELAVCKLLAQREKEKKDFKIVYQAPTKALCSERTRDWQKKFKPLGLQVAEFTGDTSSFEVHRVRKASIIITTPEKWDSITRKWSDHGILLKTIKLVLIDEVHILKDSRGATLETVVSRMKTLGSDVRFVALSATIPNSTDIAQWLGLTHTMPQMPARTFVFGEEFRPVRLEKIVLGYNLGGGNEHTLDSILDDQLPDLIVKHAQGKPVLIFCFTRKSTESAAMVLADYWGMCPENQKPWPAPTVAIQSSAARLQNFAASGVAFHHGGLERHDRASIEEAFLRGHLSIVCCTSTLAVGVNLPCHTVILKGTMGYQSGKFAEYDEFEIMQMIGRAGRPQFDTSATAIILTRIENRDKYLNLESGKQIVESTLHQNLIEHLNSEIVLGTISSLATAVRWLRGTFLAVRLRQNPCHYQLTGVDVHGRTTTDYQLEEICRTGIDRLAEVGLIKYIDGGASDDGQFRGTEQGGAMSTYMVRFDTMVMMLKFENITGMEDLVNSLCHASEFDEFRVKNTERPVLRELNKSQDIPFKFKDNITETWQKISLLIQVELTRGTLPYQQRIAFEAKQAMECMQRLLESYIVCMIADRNGHGTKMALELSRSLQSRAWEGHHVQLCQVPDIGPVNMRKLVDKQVTTVLQLADSGSVGIERLLAKNPPAAMKIADTLKSFPRLVVDGHVARTRGEDGSSGEGVSEMAVARVRFGCTNEGGVPRWRNKALSVTFFALAAAGTLLHVWRGKLQATQHEVSFPVPMIDAETVLCHFTCDDIVGTIQSKQLPCMTAPYEEIRGLVAKRGLGAQTAVSALQSQSWAPNPSKRQKVQHNASQSVVVNGTVVDCVDLASVAGSGTAKRGALVQQKLSFRRHGGESFAFQSLTPTQPRHCTGGGTQEDPFTLDDDDGDDLGSDDFDTDIFNNVELPIIKEPPIMPKEATPLVDNMQNEVLESPPRRGTLVDEPAPEVGRCSFIMPPMFEDDDEDGAAELPRELETSCPSVDENPPPSPPDETIGDGNENETGTVECDTTCEARGMSGHGKKVESSRREDVETGTKTENETMSDKEDEASHKPSEPVWVSTSTNNSIIDFLRGHVKFV